ncbi:ABC_6TM_exporters domain containing protein [Rhabdaerophilaceae bacterium]
MKNSFFSYVWVHSRKEQIFVLFLVVFSLPFYWFSLDVPKQIVNDAIQGKAFKDGITQAALFRFEISLPDFLGGWHWQITEGWLFGQLSYLFALSFLFLALTLVNGGFKYVINVRKGILGERMLRRLRFELFALVMRFKPEEIRATRSAEIASMIKDEVDPIGGFFGEAFITPAFLTTQAITALLFIMVQDIGLGLIAGGIIAIQSLIIPKLRREQLRLGRERQIASRKLAGRISEMVDAAPMLHTYAIVAHQGAEIGSRLGRLLGIRIALFKRKFFVKYLNNLLAQITPFVFYTLGGYLALQGELDIGQLVAVIAAYRDLPTPIKELIDWDQQRADVIIKFEQVAKSFSRDLLPDDSELTDTPPRADEPVVFSSLKVSDTKGVVLVEPLSLMLERPSHIALVGGQASAAAVLPKIIGRQLTAFRGEVSIGSVSLKSMSDVAAAHALAYVGPDPHVTSGTIRENVCLAACRLKPKPFGVDGYGSTEDRREAEMTGNPIEPADADWTDYPAMGLVGTLGVDAVIMSTLQTVQAYEQVYRAGMAGPPGELDAELSDRLIAARGAIRERLAAEGLAILVEPFDTRFYLLEATIGENLLFGLPTGQRFAPETVASDGFVKAILQAEALDLPLAQIGLTLVETVLDVFGTLVPGSPLLERYAFIDLQDRDELRRLVADASMGDAAALRPAVRDRLIGYALNYVEPRHRLGLLEDVLKDRILRARHSFRQFLSEAGTREISFYDQRALVRHASMRDNLLFGRVTASNSNARARIDPILQDVLAERGLEGLIVDLGLSREAGPGGRLLSAEQRATIALARAVLVRPPMIILDNALAALESHKQSKVLAALRREFAGRSMIVTLSDASQAEDFDRILEFKGAKLVSDRRGRQGAAQDAAEPDTLSIPG